MRIVIVEDEILAAEDLAQTLQQVLPQSEIIKHVQSVHEGLVFFGSDPKIDLIFSDIQLGDGLSFQIFKDVNVTAADIEAALPQFRDVIEQVPPMYSALKKDGQPLYKLARAGITVDRPARTVTISHLELLSFEGTQARILVACSKGTYIRSLVEDIGAVLGCGAHVAQLRRTEAGPFDLTHAVTLEELERAHEEGGAEALDAFMIAVDSGLQDWPIVHLTEHSSFFWLNGQPVRAQNAPLEGLTRVYNHNDEFIGVGEIDDDGMVAPRRLIRSQ